MTALEQNFYRWVRDLLPASFMASRTLEQTRLFASDKLPSIKSSNSYQLCGKLELKHDKISENTQLFYDHINHRENKEKNSSHGGVEIHMFS